MSASKKAILSSSLPDREEIRELKFAYCNGLDHREIDDLVELFAPEAIYDLGKFGCYRGSSEIREALTGLLDSFSLTSHTPTIGSIDVDGDRAVATWKALVAMQAKAKDASPAATSSTLAFIDYHDIMVRQEGRWLFSKVRLDFRGEWPIGS